MANIVRTTLGATTNFDNPDRPRQERGGSPEGVASIAQGLLFSAEGHASQEAALRIKNTLLEIERSTHAVRLASRPDEQIPEYQSAYVPEAESPEAESPEAESGNVVEEPKSRKILGIIPRPIFKSAAQIFQERQAALGKAA